MWCYLVIAFFDWKISFFQQTVGRVYCIFKYFIGHKRGKKVKPLCILLPKMIAYKRDFDETK